MGKGFSAASLERQFGASAHEMEPNPNLSLTTLSDKNQKDSAINQSFQTDIINTETKTNLLEVLLEPEHQCNHNEALNL